MSDTGAGHRSVAMALVAAARARWGERVEVRVVDGFALGRPQPLDRATNLYGPTIRHLPQAWGLIFNGTNHPRLFRALVKLLSPQVEPKLARLLRRTQPDAIVSVHPLCGQALQRTLRRLDWQVPLFSVITDLVDAHQGWVLPEATWHFAPTQEFAAGLRARGIAAEQIETTGLPVDPRFDEPADPRPLRAALGLEPTRPVALLLGGGDGAGRLERVVRSLLAADLDVQYLAVCGRNGRLRRRLRALAHPDLRVFGFVGHMPDLMHAADLVVTKAGSVTIAEALAAARPLVVTAAIPGQEQSNPHFVTRHGYGVRTRPGPDLARAVAALLDPPTRSAILANIQRDRRPGAADRVLQRVAVISGDIVPAGVQLDI